nr:mechanosensitive ion channel [Calditrichia bacterium]
NIISGLFLIAEEPFVVGDIITVNNLTGEVLSIDTLSIKLRTFQNQFVRIPNETILKSEVTTVTRFPIRRIDLLVSVAYKEDLERVRNVLMEIAAQHPLCLKEPSPQLFYEGFGSSSIDIKLGLWATREDWLRVKTDIFERVKKRFDEEGIEIPFPHVSVYTGSVSEPFPVKMADGDAKG